MDWSIELDRGLRSRNHATRVQALDAAGPRLRKLFASPTIPPPVASAFGVLPDESRLFAETMLLRLATEFRTADGALRARIVRCLLTAGGCGGIVGACVAEPDQLLRKVNVVYDTGSARDRALALRVFGCLAGITKDSVHVRSLILSSLSASTALEVKAALFAAGCVCHLSEDFSYIILEVLRGLIFSGKSEPKVIVAATKAFSKLDCTLAVIHRVHEVGKHLVLGTLEDIFKAEMLFPLSRLASKSIILFSDQVQLLSRFLDHGSSSSMKSMALKCLYFMFCRNTCQCTVARFIFSRLLPLVDEDFPLHCKSKLFRILLKVILCGKAPSIHDHNGPELSKLVLAAESSLHSSSWEMQGAAIEILVEILCFLKQGSSDLTMTILKGSTFECTECQGNTNIMSLTSEENGKYRHLYKIIAAIMNHSISVITQVLDKKNTSRNICISSKLKNKYKAHFRLILKLVICYPSAAAIVLDKLRWLVNELAQINDGCYCNAVTCAEPFQTGAAFEELNASSDNVELLAATNEASLYQTDVSKSKLDSTALNGKRNEPVMHDLILCILKCANACHDMLCKRSGGMCSLHACIKDLIRCVHQHASQYWSTYETFHMIMCACIAQNTFKCRNSDQEPVDSKEEPDIFLTPPAWIAQELCALRMTKMLIKKQKYWEAYRSSMYCCCTGLWFTASFVFRKLADAFEPSSFSFWYKSLLLFSAGELEMKLLLFPSATIKLVGELKTESDLSEDLYCAETDADSSLSGSQELHDHRAKITGICGRIILANDALASNVSSDWDFFFQRWFISLRSSFLEVLTDVLGILSAHSSAYETREGKLTVPRELLNDQVLALAYCSLRLGDLAKSYDLLAASHMDMDHHSFNSIARLAFMCSVLAFCTAYSVDLSKMYCHVESCKFPKRFSHASVLQDLQGRVDGSDRHIISQLRHFMSTSFGEPDCLQSCTRMTCSGHLEKDLYSLCRFTVASLLRVLVDAKAKETTNGDDFLSALHGGLQFLSRTFLKFMELPFVVPKYFFGVRPCLGAELYMFDSNPVNRSGMSIEPGFQLSLTLCMKWKRVLDRTAIRFVKLYCILAASSESYLDASGTRSKQFEPQKTFKMVELNTKLLHYIKNELGKGKNFHSSTDMVTAFACFEPTDSGQGFSSCLLDVSSFPEGSYQIKWHVCCVCENGSYFSLLPLNDGAVFSVRKS
ncbi:hypothetical protein QOZ80_1BG0054990 [Eleusine coracana subsp. coracana]|nr:hypothetical protein QOZ80_1BG0054990 [Eleusine coracana subsp. coracana]